MHAVCFINQKGGCAKTSSTFHLAGVYAAAGMRVLLIDADPQASLTQGIFGPEATRAMDPASTVAAVFDPDGPPMADAVIRPTPLDRVWLVPGSRAAADYNMTPRSQWAPSQGGMAEVIRQAGDDFDVALLDCPPNLHLCSWAALAASDAVVVPLQCEDYGAQGIYDITAAIDAARASVNPRLLAAGLLITMYDKRLAIHAAYRSRLVAMYGDDVFSAVVPRAKDFVEAVASRVPVTAYKPRSEAARSIKAVADELMARTGLAAGSAGRAA